ncbi:transglycosylase domain-containing protein [Pseudopelagicola sp. nBUS_20]|uniref:transglycosylase domain-containing protein n=1 Tax=Pseudopelagicola sp. nBUS_20 TaxID=3395317 RepID=UPI003EBF6B22
MTEPKKRKPPLVAEKRYGNRPKKPSNAKKKLVKPQKSSHKKSHSRKVKMRRRTSRKRRNPIVALLLRILRWIWRIVWAFTWRTGLVCSLILGLAVSYVYVSLPDVSKLLDGRSRGSVTLLDRNDKVFAWRGDQFGGVVTAKTVSKDLRNAIVATEDKRFYRHFGVSPRGVASAVSINLREGRGPLSGHGGSTITQQTAKLMCLGVKFDPKAWQSETDFVRDCRRNSLWRKAKEAVYALAMEVKYSKDEIFSIYLNRAYMGGGAYGAEAAAQRYFGKPAANLNAAQSAMLAGLLTAPSSYAPTANLQRSQNRAATVLRLMKEQGYLTSKEASYWQSRPAKLSNAAEAQVGGYFADWVMGTGPEFFTYNTTEDVVLKTTLDPRIQSAVEDGLKWVFENKVREGSEAQAAIVVMSADGAVRAMVGGRRTKVSGAFNRATQAKRQTGSAFKPFVYATALDLGRHENDTVLDEPYCQIIPGSGKWCPKNYTGKHYGEVTLTFALMNSLNVPAVKVSEQVGRENVRTVAEMFGIESDLAAGPALALGASESSLLEMTGAYAGILNGGSSVMPYGLVELRLLGDEDALMGTGGGIGERVISDASARELIWMMKKVVSEGTGTRAQLADWQVAGKTGTTQAARDAWFIGFTNEYVAGVWMGYDDNTPLTGVTGGGLPAEIWREAMVRVHEGLEPKPLPAFTPTKSKQGTRPKKKRKGLDNFLSGIIRDIVGDN